MGIDASAYNEEEKKKRELSKTEQRKGLEKVAKQQEKKERLHQEEVTHDELENLKNLLEHHEIDDTTIQKVQEISQDATIDTQEMKEIFEMIEDFQNNENQKKYIPDDLQITKEEYASALHDEEQRSKTLVKLDTILWIFADHASPWTMRSINVIGGLSLLLDKNLIVTQEKHIDIKRSLEEKDGKQLGGFFSQLSSIFSRK